MFRMATGQVPFPRDYETAREGHLQGQLPNPQSLNPDVNIGLSRVLMKALSANPKQRFATWEEFRTALGFLLPGSERAQITAQSSGGIPELSDRDRKKIGKQLSEAKALCGQNEYQAALRTLDAIFMVSGPQEIVLKLHNQIWEIMHGAANQKLFKQASAYFDKKQVDKALATLNEILSVQPRHIQGLSLQARLFERFGERVLRSPEAMDHEVLLNHAEAAKSAGNGPLAENLWVQVLLSPEGEDLAGRKKLQLEKQRAEAGLKSHYQSLHSTLRTKNPVTQEAPPAPESAPAKVEEPPPAPALPEMPVVPAVNSSDPPSPAAQPSPAGFDQAELPLPPEPEQPEALEDRLKKLEAEVLGDGEEQFFDDEEEQYFDDEPQKVEVQTPASTKQGKSKLILIGAVAAGVLLLFAGVYFWWSSKNSKYQHEAQLAFDRAAEIEQSDDLEGARQAWAAVVSDFPKFDQFEDVLTRQKALELKIKKRAEDIQTALTAAESWIDEGVILDESDDNAVANLRKVLEFEPENAKALALMERIRLEETNRALILWEEGKTQEAKDTYYRLLDINPEFINQDLETNIRQWVQSEIIDPGLAKLDRAIKRKQWEKAREISEELKPEMADTSLLDARWDEAYQSYNTLYQAAREKDQEEKMLAALDVMTLIKPEDTNLVEMRDRLSRDLNLSKITALEKKVTAALKQKKYNQSGKFARQLQRLDSKNPVAEDAIGAIRRALKIKIDQIRGSDPKGAVKIYKDLLGISNWKSYQKEMKVLETRISAFNKRVGSFKKQSAKPLGTQSQLLGELLRLFNDFSGDAEYQRLEKMKELLDKEDQRLRELLQWEQQSFQNQSMSYQSILQKIGAERGFQFPYSKSQLNGLKEKYRSRMANYEGEVTLVIRSAEHIKGLKGRKPKVFCELKTGGQVFRSEPEAAPSPKWNYICHIVAKPGDPLTFNIYQKNRRGDTLLGSVSLPGVPKNGKALPVKSTSSPLTLLIDVRRNR